MIVVLLVLSNSITYTRHCSTLLINWNIVLVPVKWFWTICGYSDSKVHGANMGPTWALSAPNGPHVGPKNLAIRVTLYSTKLQQSKTKREVCTYISGWSAQPKLTKNYITPDIQYTIINRFMHTICACVPLVLCFVVVWYQETSQKSYRMIDHYETISIFFSSSATTLHIWVHIRCIYQKWHNHSKTVQTRPRIYFYGGTIALVS